MTCDHGHHRSAAPVLRGTPVVPGVAYGPVLLVRTEVSPDAIAALRRRQLRRRRGRPRGVRRRGRRRRRRLRRARPAGASGAAAEVLTASAGLARDKGLRGAVRKPLRAGDDLLAAVHAAVEQFATIFTGMGGLMAERVTDLRDIERRVVARLVGEPEPGVPDSRRAVGPGRRGPRPRRHRRPRPAVVVGLVTERGGPTSHTAIIARQLGIPCVVGVAGAIDSPAGSRAPRRRHRRHRRDRPRRRRGRRAGSPPTGEARAALEAWTGPGATADGTPVKILANVADGESAPVRRRRPGRGRRPVPHRAVLPQPQGRAVGRGAGRASTARC